MVSALVFGIIASSSLVIGAAIGAYREPPERIVATALAFASGALITALAFELFQPAFEIGGPWVAGSGLLAGAAVFASIDYVLDEYYVSDERGFSLLAAVTLDGIPRTSRSASYSLDGTRIRSSSSWRFSLRTSPKHSAEQRI